MRREVAADEVRGAGAHAPARRAVARGRDDVRVIGEAEIIVARERQELAAVDDDVRALRRRERAPGSLPSVGVLRREVAEEPRDQGRRHTVRIRPPACP